jgi:two-component system chemotaxis sensor kinase CheA
MELQEDIRDFLIESNENLENLDRELVELEKDPGNARLISSAFRAIHTIKGTSGFFGFDKLGALTHVTENLLSQVRDGQRELTPQLTSLVLEAIDEVKAVLGCIEKSGNEGEDTSAALRDRLEQAHRDIGQAQQSPELSAPKPRRRSAGYQSLRRPELAAEESATVEVVQTGTAKPEPNTHLVEGKIDPTETKAASREPVPQQPEATSESAAHLTESTIRVDVALLNRLMNLVGELVLARNQLLQETSAQTSLLQQTSQRLNLITSELQESVMKTRMQPIGVVWNKLPRVVRDLAAQCGKKIRIEMEGAETELDKTIIEAIKDPLTHIVRNCCDHGIETPEKRSEKGKKAEGLIQLRAYHEGGVVNIEISDDGGGIDADRVKAKALEKGLLRPEQAAQMTRRDALNLIFLPGFSTAATVTAISGRGVGMDVVKNNIERIGGNVEVLNRSEGGTTVRVKIPLTLAIIPGLVVTLNRNQDVQPAGDAACRRWRAEERFIIPQANLLELVRIQSDEQATRIENVHGTPIFHHRSKLLPLVYLGQVLGRPPAEAEVSDVINIVVLQAENRKIGLVVDRICDTQEIVVKPLGRQLKGLSCYVGATIMGDGRTALILDVVGLARLAGLGAQARAVAETAPASLSPTAERSQKLLLFRAGIYERMAVPLALVDRLEEVPASSIKRAAGRLVLHYRSGILPLATLSEFLEAGSEPSSLPAGMVPVIVFTDGARRMGLIVDQIIDILDEVITARRSVSAPGILGSAIINGHITDLLDLQSLLMATGENWISGEGRPQNPNRRLLVIEGRLAAREMLHALLETEGYRTTCVGSVAEALARVKQETFDLILTPIAVGGEALGGLQFLRALREDPAYANTPVMALDRPRLGAAREVQPDGLGAFDACVFQEERDAMLRAIAALLDKHSAARVEALK